MEHRARTRPTLRQVAMTAALGALLVPAAAGQADARTRSPKLPVVKSVSPMKAAIGQKLTIRGRNFLRGRAKDTVVFRRDGGKAVFVKSDIATAKLIKVTLPAKLADSLIVKDGVAVHTRFRVRVLAKRLGKAFTALGSSPSIGPVLPPAPATPPASAPAQDCDGDGQPNSADGDDDNDLLPDTLEKSIGTDPCLRDTDGDGVEDGFEYASAKDLNDQPHFSPTDYPGKKPYPSPLGGKDANIDFDGDGLTLTDEYQLWIHFGSHSAPLTLNYSDGKQATNPVPVASYAPLQSCVTKYPWALDFDRDGITDPSESTYLDRDGDGMLSDDELDADGDCLSNWDESHGRMQRTYWDKQYSRETPFPTPMGEVDLFDADSDGDGIPDGVDDQDHDGLVNIAELSRMAATHRLRDLPDLDPSIATSTPAYGRVNPFNPCLPSVTSATCPRYIPFEHAWAPFDGRPYIATGDDPNYLVLQ